MSSAAEPFQAILNLISKFNDIPATLNHLNNNTCKQVIDTAGIYLAGSNEIGKHLARAKNINGYDAFIEQYNEETHAKYQDFVADRVQRIKNFIKENTKIYTTSIASVVKDFYLFGERILMPANAQKTLVSLLEKYDIADYNASYELQEPEYFEVIDICKTWLTANKDAYILLPPTD